MLPYYLFGILKADKNNKKLCIIRSNILNEEEVSVIDEINS